METDVGNDFQDYWNEYKVVACDPKILENDEKCIYTGSKSLDYEGVDEAEWLILAGLPHLTDAFLKGQLIDDAQLEPVINVLSIHQANAVLRRVNSLNQTVRHRARARNKKPDIRDVFKDIQNNENVDGAAECDADVTIVESATSDKIASNRFVLPKVSYYYDTNDGLVEIGNTESKGSPFKIDAYSCLLPQHEIFRRSGRTERDIVASENADGIRMLAFQKLGTLREPSFARYCQEPSISPSLEQPSSLPNITKREEVEIERSRIEGSSDDNSIGFEHMWQFPTSLLQFENDKQMDMDENELILGRTWIDTLGEEDVINLKPLLFVELSAIFDKAAIPFPKIKSRKFKKKRDGNNVFGVSLGMLTEQDLILSNDQSKHIPLIFTKILDEIERRGINEEGVLRVAGNKAKVDNLCQEIEKNFYLDIQKINQVLQRSSIHDLTAVFKKLLRDLPEPILTTELINLFYQSHRLLEFEKLLNLLVLLLPSENRLTLLAIVSFMRRLTQHEQSNKMSSHNVSMIIAPSIFPPRYVQVDKNLGDLRAEIELAAVSCRITETLMKCVDRLNIVPPCLILQLRRMNHLRQSRVKNNLGKKLNNKKIEDLLIANESVYDNNVVRINAPQFELTNFPIKINSSTTVGDVVLRIIDIGSKPRHSARNIHVEKIKRRDMKQKVLSELAPNGNLSCLLSTADSEMALSTHFLYEYGGNISQRRIEPSALMLPVYQQNPNASWMIQCDHRNAIRRR